MFTSVSDAINAACVASLLDMIQIQSSYSIWNGVLNFWEYGYDYDDPDFWMGYDYSWMSEPEGDADLDDVFDFIRAVRSYDRIEREDGEDGED